MPLSAEPGDDTPREGREALGLLENQRLARRLPHSIVLKFTETKFKSFKTSIHVCQNKHKILFE